MGIIFHTYTDGKIECAQCGDFTEDGCEEHARIKHNDEVDYLVHLNEHRGDQ
jgi:hypothetical protein